MKHPLSHRFPASSVARDPQRLLAGGGSPFERGLLESVAGDRMSEASEQRLAQLLELLPARPNEASASGAAPEVAPGTAVTRVGQLAMRAGFGALGLVAAFLLTREPAPTRSAELAAPTTAAPTKAAPTKAAPMAAAQVATARAVTARAASPEPAASAIVQELPAATSSGVVTRAAVPRPKRSERVTHEATPKPPPAATAGDWAHGLREELRLLEGAKAALREGRSSAAADTLAEHARRFPAGELVVEAELLRIDLALVRGERSRAWATARRLLALPSASQYRARLEALLRDAETRTDEPVGANRARTDMTERR